MAQELRSGGDNRRPDDDTFPTATSSQIDPALVARQAASDIECAAARTVAIWRTGSKPSGSDRCPD